MKGKLIHEDLGAGAWILETKDGKRYTLDGDIPAHLKGKQVKVDGDVSEGGGFGFAMTGDPIIEVRSISAA